MTSYKDITITKEQLIKHYIEDKLSLEEIGKIFNLKSSTMIRRLLNENDIKIRDRKESNPFVLAKKVKMSFHIDKDILINELEIGNIKTICEKYNTSRKLVKELMKHYGLDKEYFKYTHLKEELKKEENKNLSLYELSLKYNADITVIKYNKADLEYRLYSINEIKEKIKSYDMNNQGVVKIINYGDKNLYDSVVDHIKEHKLDGSKFTEKVYRLVNDFDKDKVVYCSNCKANPLQFKTYSLGSGNSDYQLCRSCNNVLNGVSKLSQEMFNKLYSKLNETEKLECHYHDLNSDFVLYINNDYIDENANKRYYKLDFKFKNKIIEFDGLFYHNDESKEIAKDKFFKYKGYDVLHITDIEYRNSKKQAIEKCLIFLRE